MTQVVFFSYGTLQTLQQEVNTWLALGAYTSIKDIKYSPVEVGSHIQHSCCIIYTK